MSPHQRAKPLAPDDRRRAIVDAVIPLLLEKGSSVTSREIAEAAGVAEGTIFRAFPDKTSIIVEAVKASMDPTPVVDALDQIPADQPLEAQLEAAADALLAWTTRVAALFAALRTVDPEHRPSKGRKFVTESNQQIVDHLVALLERHPDRLRVEPRQAAMALRGLVFASAHPMNERKLGSAEIVDILVHGVAKDGA